MMTMDLFLPKGIGVWTKAAKKYIATISDGFQADCAWPVLVLCQRCGLEFEPHSDWETTTCSNCYGDRVFVLKLRLEFENWGEQNGGISETRRRYVAAQKLAQSLGMHGKKEDAK